MSIGFKLRENQEIDPEKVKIEIDLSQSKKIVVSYIKDDIILVLHTKIRNDNNCDVVCCAELENGKKLGKEEGSQTVDVKTLSDPNSVHRQVYWNNNPQIDVYSHYSFGIEPIIIPSQKEIMGDLVFRICRLNSTSKLTFFNKEKSEMIFHKGIINISYLPTENRQ